MARFRLVFTPTGAAALVIAAILLVRSLSNRNSYEMVFACVILFLLLILGITGAWKSRKLKMMEPSWKTPFPMTACLAADNGQSGQTMVNGLDSAVPLFFRLHFNIHGRFLPCGQTAGTKKGYSVSVETAIKYGETSGQLSFDFPVSGLFTGNGYCRLRDIFGFFSFPCGRPQQRTVKVRCAPCLGKMTHINAQSGAEDQRNKPAADIERYYMREYTPGDRLRDINWKSSEKIDTLITRISTDNQEKVSRIEVHFRNYCKAGASLESLWLLDRAKARLSYFLRSLMEQNSSFIFDVRTAGGSWEITDHDSLEEFFEELAGISFMPPQHEAGLLPGAGDVYVFSTACDAGLPAFLLACTLRPVNLFLIQPEPFSGNQQEQLEVLRISGFLSMGLNFAVNWFARGKVKPMGVRANKTEMFYAGIKL